MKNSFYTALLLFFCAVFTLRAEDGGGRIGEYITPFKPTVIKGAEIYFDEDAEDEENNWVLAVFFNGPSSDIQEIEQILQQTMAGSGDVIYLSGAPLQMLQSYCETLPADHLFMNIAFDNDNSIAKRVLPGNVVLPFAVLADRTGEIIWMGEPLEFPDMFPALKAGTFDNSKRAEVLPHYSTLASAIRSGNSRNVRTAAAPILQTEPSNPTAVQAMMFFSEQSGDAEGAWRILKTAIDAAPGNRLLSMLALTFGGRHPGYAGLAVSTVNKEIIAGGTDREKLAAVFMLLDGYGFEITAIDMAAYLLDTVKDETPELLEFKALCAYRRGDLAAAVNFQEAAAKADEGGSSELKKRLDFYQTLKERLDK